MDNKPVFGLLTGTVAISFGLVLLSFIGMNFPQFWDNKPFNIPILIFYLILDNLFDLYLFYKKDQSKLVVSKIRGTLIIGFMTYLSISLLNNPFIFNSLIPDIVNISSVIIFTIISFTIYAIRYPVFFRNELYTLIYDNHHKSLMDTINSEPQMVSSLFRGIISLRNKSYLLIIASSIIIIINSYLSKTPWYLSISYILLLFSSLGLIALSNTFIEEHKFFSFGIITPISFKKSRLNLAYLLIVISIIPALVFSFDKALLPNIISTFFNWYMHLVQYQSPSTQPTSEPDEILPDFEISQILNYQNQPPNMMWSMILEIGKYVLLLLLIVGIMYFLLRPLLKKKINFLTIIKYIIKLFHELVLLPLQSFFKFILQLFNFHWEPRKQRQSFSLQSIKPKEYLNHLIKSRKLNSKGQLTLIDNKSMILYLKFLTWIHKLGINWSLSNTPVDIAKKVISFLSTRLSIDSFNQSHLMILELTKLLEEDLFSRNQINSLQLNRMEKHINYLLSLNLNL